MLNEDEKLTLGMVLREKIIETHDIEDVIYLQLEEVEEESKQIILKESLKNVQSVRDDCYSIALKLGIK